MFYGIVENPDSPFRPGQPVGSDQAYEAYMSWKSGSRYWKLSEVAYADILAGVAASVADPSLKALADGLLGEEDPDNPHWVKFENGYHEIVLDLSEKDEVDHIMVRFLNYHLQGIGLPEKLYLYISDDAEVWNLAAI